MSNNLDTSQLENKFITWIENYYRKREVKDKEMFLYHLIPPYTLDDLDHIQTVNLIEIPESEIPSFLFDLPHLKELTFLRCELTHLSNKIKNLKHLEILSLDTNEIKSIPACIGELSSLKSLSISGANIEKIPETFGQLKRLESFYLSDCPRLNLDTDSSFYTILSRWNCLKILSISNIPFNVSQNGEVFKNLRNLSELSLNECNLGFIPEELLSLNYLEDLDLGNNQQIKFPSPMLKEACPNVKNIHLENCGLEEIPPLIFSLKSLETLDIRQNNIDTIPHNIAHLENLEMIHLEQNPIKRISRKIITLPHLYRIFVDKRSFKGFKSIFERCEERGIAILIEESFNGPNHDSLVKDEGDKEEEDNFVNKIDLNENTLISQAGEIPIVNYKDTISDFPVEPINKFPNNLESSTSFLPPSPVLEQQKNEIIQNLLNDSNLTRQVLISTGQKQLIKELRRDRRNYYKKYGMTGIDEIPEDLNYQLKIRNENIENNHSSISSSQSRYRGKQGKKNYQNILRGKLKNQERRVS